MALFNFEEASLKLFYETGLDEFGKPVVTSKTYRNVRDEVTIEKIATVAQAIASLSKNPLHQVKKSETDVVEF